MMLPADNASHKAPFAHAEMDTTDSEPSPRTTINEIRTERLSKALQRMRKKSLSVCAMRDISKINIKVDPPAEHSPKRFGGLKNDHDCEDTGFLRVRTGSVPANSLALAVKSFATAKKELVQEGTTAGHMAGTNTLNRLMKQLLHRREKDADRCPCTNSPTAQAKKAAGNYEPCKRKSIGSPHQCAHIFGQQSPGFNIRSGMHNHKGSHSKNSSTTSSRCQSPMGYFTMLNLAVVETGAPNAASDIRTVLIIGAEGVGKAELVKQFMRLDARNGTESMEIDFMDENNAFITFSVENMDTRLRFIEVNNEKNDLWQTLSADCYIALYKPDNLSSFRNVSQIIGKLRDCSSSIPVFIVANKPHSSLDAKRPPSLTDDGRHLAKHNNCSFFDLCATGHSGSSAEDLLVSIVSKMRSYFHLRRQHCAARRRGKSNESSSLVHTDSRGSGDQDRMNFPSNWFHFRTWSAESNSSSTSSKTSPSHSLARCNLWNKRRDKRGPAGNLGVSLVNLTTNSTIHKYFKFISRRKSLSLENLASQRASIKSAVRK